MVAFKHKFSIRSLLADTDVFNKFSIQAIFADKTLVTKKTTNPKCSAFEVDIYRGLPNSATNFTSYSSQGYKALPFKYEKYKKLTYSSAILLAIRRSPGNRLLLRGIYDWIAINCPYIPQNNAKWRDTVRHNLSHNEIFVQVSGAEHKTIRGKYWTINESAENMYVLDCTGKLRQKSQILKHKRISYQPYQFGQHKDEYKYAIARITECQLNTEQMAIRSGL